MLKDKESKQNVGGVKPSKKIWKKWWFWLIVVIVLGAMGSGNSDDTQEVETADVQETEAEVQTHIYDNVVIRDVMNGLRTDKIGEYSVIEMRSDEVTTEILEDWYFNYVEKNDFNWNMILYSDKENEGIYAINGYINKDVLFEVDEYGEYSLGDSSNCVIYVPNEENILVKISDDLNDSDDNSDTPDVSSQTEDNNDNIPSEYKSALKKAESYSDTMYMSKAAIYDQLTSEYGEQFTEEAAQYAMDNLQADWKVNALLKAKDYSDTMYMSKAAIYDQLISEYGEQFTEEEAQYAVDNLQTDYKANALKKAESYQDDMDMSPAAIYDQLISEYGEQFTKEEAQYAIDNLK